MTKARLFHFAVIAALLSTLVFAALSVALALVPLGAYDGAD